MNPNRSTKNRSVRNGANIVATGLIGGALVLLALGGCPWTIAPITKGGTLRLQLAPDLDSDGDIKVTSFAQAVLLDRTGKTAKTATIVDGVVNINLDGVTAGTYFIEVNGDSDDLVPTRIDDPTQDLTQYVGATLRPSVIGSLDAPTYRIGSHPKGQGEHAVVKFSDGSNATPERYAYAIVGAQGDHPITEIRVLGTGEMLSSLTATVSMHPILGYARVDAQPMQTWVLNTPPKPFHCDVYGGDGYKCTDCHFAIDLKPQRYSDISPINGWCYKCHYSNGGSEMGFVDPNQ